jgi:hypothetical protein
VHELADVDVGAHLVVGFQARDLGVDEGGLALARERRAVVSVGDEVGAAELLHLDRRHPPVRERAAQAREPSAREAAPGRKLRSKSAVRSSEPMIRSTGISRTPR